MRDLHAVMLMNALGRCAAVAATVSMSVATPAALAREQLTPEALLALSRVSEAELSPGGDQIAYVTEAADPSGGAIRYSVSIAPSDDVTKAREILTGLARAPQPQWAADGKSLFYISVESGASSVWTVASDGQGKRRITDYPVDVVAFQVPRNGRSILTAHKVFPECGTLACTREKLTAEKNRRDSAHLYVDGQAPRFFSSYGDGRFVNLFSAALAPGAVLTDGAALTRGLRYDVMESAYGLQRDISVTPDGVTAYFASRPSGSNQGDEAPKAIYRVDMAGGKAFAAFISDPGQSVYSPRVSPDGTRLAYLKAEGTTYTAPRVSAWVRDLASGEDRQVGGDLDSLLTNLSWSSDGEALFATGPEKGRFRLFTFKANGERKFSAITAPGSISAFSVAGRRIAYIHSSFTATPEIAIVNAASPSKIVARSNFSPNAADRFNLGEVARFDFPGWNGETVEGFLIKPANFTSDRKYPVVLNIHGGPNGAFADRWDNGVSNPQLLAAKGYAVVMFNPHGSSGYGTPFGRSVLGHWGDRPLEDLKAGWAHVVQANDFVDTDRACAMGGSYGGYLTLLIAGRWNEPWKCLVERAGIFDIRTFMYGNDITAYNKLSFVAEPWNDSSYESQNPVNYAKNWKVPIFVFAGGLDYRVPLDQSISAYGAARARNIPSKFLYFPDESHSVSKHGNAIRQFHETISWLDKWVGKE